MLVNPSEDQKIAYKFSLTILDFVISQLKPGEMFKNIYQKVKALVKQIQPNLLPGLVTSLGHLTGLGSRDNVADLNEKSPGHVEAESAFVITAGFEFANTEDACQSQPWAVCVADTVFLSANSETHVFTSQSKISLAANMMELVVPASALRIRVIGEPDNGNPS